MLPQRPRDGHKGTFGRTLVIGGSRSYVGATVLACSGAYRAGAGLVTLATGKSVYSIAATGLTEATFLPLPETANGGISRDALVKVRAALPGYDSLVVGCGMGQNESTLAFLNELLLDDDALNIPAVIDADALNGLATFDGWANRMKLRAALTPHPGEMSRLSGLPVSERGRAPPMHRGSRRRVGTGRRAKGGFFRGGVARRVHAGQPLCQTRRWRRRAQATCWREWSAGCCRRGSLRSMPPPAASTCTRQRQSASARTSAIRVSWPPTSCRRFPGR